MIQWSTIKSSLEEEKRSRVLSFNFLWFEYLLSHFFNTMQKGTIARLTDRGFGFISREGEEKDLFFHANELQGVQYNDLREGDPVTFDVVEGPKGLNATNVKKA